MKSFKLEVLQNNEWRASTLTLERAKWTLEQGTGRMDPSAEEPPTELLGMLEDRIAKVEVLGPQLDAQSLVKKAADGIFRDGLRQLTVDGYPLRWMSNERDLRNGIETALSGCSQKPGNIFQQFRSVYIAYASRQPGTLQTSRPLSDDKQREAGVVPIPNPRTCFSEKTTEYKTVGAEWRQYFEDLKSIETQLDRAVDLGVSEGRIICAEDTQKGDRLVPNDAVMLRQSHNKVNSFHYVLSKDLPKEWFSGLNTLPSRRRKAIDWINRAGVRIASQGKRATVQQLQTAAAEKFELTKHAVEEIWPKVDFPGKGKKGAIRQSDRISDSSINKIE